MNVSTRHPSTRAWLTVSLANLVANARTVQAAARGAGLLPMVKADAYGLGAIPVVQALEALDPWGFGVATLEEGLQLRTAGCSRPIVVFTPAAAALRERYRQHDLRAVLDAPEVASHWDLPFHLEIDTGMARCGVRWDQPAAIAACATPHLEGVFTHFYHADERPDSVAEQWTRFCRALEALPSRPALIHAANSAAAWRLAEKLDLARPGIFLYGGRAGPDLPAPRPVATLRAPVVSLRRVSAGTSVSYGGEWVAPRATTVATLGIGYADGLFCSAAGKARVLLGGVRRPIIGRVTMDLTMVDIGPDGTGGRLGEPATLIGSDGGDEITVDEFAAWAGTISYEALARLGARLMREYVA